MVLHDNLRTAPVPRLWCKGQFYFLPLWHCLFWPFHPNGVVQYAFPSIWLPSHEVVWGFVLVLADHSRLLTFNCRQVSVAWGHPILFILYQLESISVFPHIPAIMLWTYMSLSWWKCMFSFLVCRYLGVELLVHMTTLCWAHSGTAKSFSSPPPPLAFLHSYQSLHTLTKGSLGSQPFCWAWSLTCSINFISLVTNDVEPFSMGLFSQHIFFGEESFQDFCLLSRRFGGRGDDSRAPMFLAQTRRPEHGS